MGASFVAKYIKDCTKEELRLKWKEYVEMLRREYGNNSYNGTLSTCDGLTITDGIFTDRAEAEEYICEHTQKWEEALAVKLINANHNGWIIGGWVAE